MLEAERAGAKALVVFMDDFPRNGEAWKTLRQLQADEAHNCALIGKLIVHGATREEAIARMRLALESFIVEGIHTTIPFVLEILQTPEFIAGDVDTKFVERYMAGRAATAVA